MLKRLCMASGVSGNETGIRNAIINEAQGFEPDSDVFGNLFFETGGAGRKILIDAHMDEVGFIVSKIDDGGYLRFKTVGGIDTGVILGKRVFAGDRGLPGIIGVKAVHLQNDSEQDIDEDSLCIDIGARSRDEAAKYIKPGDYVTFGADYTEFGDRCVLSKALDNRAGCAAALEIMKKCRNNDLCFAFTVQEEVGCRGAGAAVRHFKPDIAIVLETTICRDVYPSLPHETPTTLGGGVVFPFMDSSAVHDRELIASLIKTAEENGIPWQYKKINLGGTNAGSIMRTGIPTAVVAIPCRSLHSQSCVISLNDYDNMVKLIEAYVRKEQM